MEGSEPPQCRRGKAASSPWLLAKTMEETQIDTNRKIVCVGKWQCHAKEGNRVFLGLGWPAVKLGIEELLLQAVYGWFGVGGSSMGIMAEGKNLHPGNSRCYINIIKHNVGAPYILVTAQTDGLIRQ